MTEEDIWAAPLFLNTHLTEGEVEELRVFWREYHGNPVNWKSVPILKSPTIVHSESGMKAILRSFCERFPYDKRAAQFLGITVQHLRDMLAGKRGISSATAAKLGYTRKVVYELNETD